jgi:hypothetical protein
VSEPGLPGADGPRWNLALTLLSLERIQPFLTDMALNIASPSRLLSVARDLVTRYLTLEDDPDLGDDERLFARDRLVTETIDTIVAALGPDGGRRVVDWVATTLPYDAGSAANFIVRRRTLGRLSKSESGSLGIALTPAGRKILTRVVAAYGTTTADFRRRLAQDATFPLSTWDQGIAATYTSDADPMDWVEDIAENVAADSVWRELMTSLPTPDRACLVDLARREAARLHVSADLLDLW